MQFRNYLQLRAALLFFPLLMATSTSFSVACAQAITNSFTSAQRIQLGNQVSQVVSADLNRDGKPDFVAVTFNYPGEGQVNLFVLLNKGNGTFTQSQPMLINRTSNVCVADVNGDGIPDLIYGDPNRNGYLAVAFGKGDGTFAAPNSYRGPTSLASSNAIVTGDFNGDGKIDIAEASIEHGTVTVLLNDGAGTFHTNRTYTVGALPDALAVADFNGDGIDDLVVVDSDVYGDVRLLYGSRSNILRPGAVTNFLSPSAAAIGDVDRDGNLDILVASGGEIQRADSFTLTEMLGRPDGTFESKPLMTNLGPVGNLALLDLNRDGKLDLGITMNEFTPYRQTGYFDLSRLAIYPGNGDGTFQNPRIYNVDSDPVSLLIADTTGDGYFDLVTANDDTGTLNIFRGESGGVFAGAPITLSQYAQGIVTADFNHDGYPDVAVVNSPPCNAPCDGTVTVFAGSGSNWFQPGVRYAIGMHGAAIAAGDVNGDGITDLVVTNNTPGDLYDVSVLLGKGDGTFSPARNYTLGALSGEAYLADINNDHKLDLVTFGGVAFGTGHGTFGPLHPFTALGQSTVKHLAVADFNHDGFLDVAVADNPQGSSPYVDELDVLLGNGAGTFRSVQSHDLGTEVTGMAAGKMNADSFPDLVLTYGGPNQNNLGEIAILLGKGDGTFPIGSATQRGNINYEFSTLGWSVAIADLNNDGINDIAVSAANPAANFVRDDFIVFPGKGDGTMGPPTTFPALSSDLTQMAIADFTLDGRKDVAITNYLGISRLINTGVPVTPPKLK